MPSLSSLRTLATKVLAGTALAVLVGCGGSTYHRHYSYGHYHRHHGPDAVTVAATGIVAGVVIVDAISRSQPRRESPPPDVVYVYRPMSPRNAALVAPPPPPRAEDAPTLDPTATRAAFSKVDLSSCNAPPIYGHAKVSLNPDGRISKVVIEDPANLDPRIANCIGQRIGEVTVPPFRGSMVVLGTTFRTR